MIIIHQDGETVFTLKEPFKVEILPIRDYSTCFELYNPRTPKGYYLRLADSDESSNIGDFKLLDSAKQAISEFVMAYERGDRAFRIPRDDIKEEVAFNAK